MKKQFKCDFCNKYFIDYLSNRKSKTIFCNRKCQYAYLSTQTGEKARHWKNAKTNHINGYFIITRKGRTYLEHNFIMEESIGRKLEKYEVVHHINGNKKDNRIENLKLMTRSEHTSFHMQGNQYARKYL